MEWSVGRTEKESLALRNQAGENFMGKQVVSTEGDCKHSWDIFLGCSFIWVGKRVLLKPGLPIAFFFAHMWHSYHPLAFFLFYPLSRMLLFSILRYFTVTVLLPDM